MRELNAITSKTRTLDWRSATFVLFLFLLVPILCVLLLEAVFHFIAHSYGIDSPRQIRSLLAATRPKEEVAGIIVGCITVVYIGLKHFKSGVMETGPTGAAWITGGWIPLLKGFGIGCLISIFAIILNRFNHPHLTYSDVNPVSQMAMSPGIGRVIWMIATVVIAPSSEEMMFRGILYGGYRKSLGPVWAAALTTLLFTLWHFSYFIHLPYKVISILLASVATLYCRLHWNAIGPAIALHVGYNLMANIHVLLLVGN